MITFDLREVSNLTKAISHFQGLHANLIQMGRETKDGKEELLKDFWTRKVQSHTKGKHMGWLEPGYETQLWAEINVHHVIQNWGSTSCGWGGIGGAAMTDSYTTVIENTLFGVAAVYYSGTLAYVLEVDEEFQKHKANGFRTMPDIDGYGLKILYTNTRRR